MVAAGKGENDLAVGNVVGSNIFNILLILGASATIKPIALDITAVYDTLILIVASLIVYLCALSTGNQKRRRSNLPSVLSRIFCVCIDAVINLGR